MIYALGSDFCILFFPLFFFCFFRFLFRFSVGLPLCLRVPARLRVAVCKAKTKFTLLGDFAVQVYTASAARGPLKPECIPAVVRP